MIQIGLLLFPQLTQLDLTAPYEVFARTPGAKVHLIWKTLDPVRSDSGLTLHPTATFESCPPLDVICVPGGQVQLGLLEDEVTLDFLRRQAATAKWVTAVCSGSLVLGAAGLLQGYRATSHWASRDQLSLFGAIPVEARVVTDRNRITGGGVTAGIDFALTLVAKLLDEKAARWIQLNIEYDPQPPFDSGSPLTARPALVDEMRQVMSGFLAARRAVSARAGARLQSGEAASGT